MTLAGLILPQHLNVGLHLKRLGTYTTQHLIMQTTAFDAREWCCGFADAGYLFSYKLAGIVLGILQPHTNCSCLLVGSSLQT